MGNKIQIIWFTIYGEKDKTEEIVNVSFRIFEKEMITIILNENNNNNNNIIEMYHDYQMKNIPFDSHIESVSKIAYFTK